MQILIDENTSPRIINILEEDGHDAIHIGDALPLGASDKEIPEAHGWEITVDESEQGGARFEFTGVEAVR